MGYVKLTLKAQKDFVDRLAQAAPLDALSELIWNSFDERATGVAVNFEVDDEIVLKRIRVIDNGASLRYDNAKEKYEKLGDSDKASRRLESGEPLHGSKGEGRHKALSLGATVDWRFVYERDESKWCYRVEGIAGNESPFRLYDEERAAPTEQVGCTVTVSDIKVRLSVARFQYFTTNKSQQYLARITKRLADLRRLDFDRAYSIICDLAAST